MGPGEEAPKSKEEEKQRGLLDPHLACYSPLNVINWQIDEVCALPYEPGMRQFDSTIYQTFHNDAILKSKCCLSRQQVDN